MTGGQRIVSLGVVRRVLVRAPARSPALRAAWRALIWSRLAVVVAGVGGLAALGRVPGWARFDPAGTTAPFGGVVDALVAPAARWDTVWYLAIAHDGYRDPARTAFFPLYPLLVRAVAGVVRSPVLAGVAVSLVALLVALYFVHRLAELELGPRAAGIAVALVALFPMSFFLSAVYAESLFLALAVGAFYAARRERWAWAGVLGALAAATRSTGVGLVVPLATLALCDAGRGWPPPLRRPPRGALWLALVPLGLGAYVGYLALRTGSPLAPFHVQDVWFRHFAGPFGGVWDGAVAAWDGVRQLASGARAPVYFGAAGGDPFQVAGQNLMLFGFLVLAAAATVGTLRRLPAAYGVWALVSLAVPLSYPVGPQPLMSLPRFLAVLFPLHLWAAAWLARRPRAVRPVLGVCVLLLVMFTVEFATWRFVA